MGNINSRFRRQLAAMTVLLACGCAFSAAAKETWPHTWGGGFNDYASSAALDSQGNIYVAGTTNSFGAGGADVLILKYGQGGVFKWAKTWGGSGNDYAPESRWGLTAISTSPA